MIQDASFFRLHSHWVATYVRGLALVTTGARVRSKHDTNRAKGEATMVARGPDYLSRPNMT